MVENTQGLRLAITGGGTGGHVLPALAVVDELRRRGVIADLIWIGSREGVERQAAEEAGIRFVAIPTGKLRRYLSVRNLTDAARLPLGVLAARRALVAFRPDVVLSTGGFVSVPAVVAARGIAPVLTHEQTAILGLANRINARFADVLAVSHSQTEPHRATAAPPRGSNRQSDSRWSDSRRPLTAVCNASGLTARSLSSMSPAGREAQVRSTSELPRCSPAFSIMRRSFTRPVRSARTLTRAISLSSGKRFRETVRRRYHVVEFLRDELPDVYAAADLVVGRAGAGTIAELAYVGLPAILVPLPGARGDEQALNARVLGDAGAAVVIAQSGRDAGAPGDGDSGAARRPRAARADGERGSQRGAPRRRRPTRRGAALPCAAAVNRYSDVIPTSIASATVSARITFNPATSVVPRRADDAGMTALSKPRRCASPSRRSI